MDNDDVFSEITYNVVPVWHISEKDVGGVK